MTKEWVVDAPDLASSLAQDFSLGPVFNEQGQRFLTEETVDSVRGLKMQIFSDEHPPPHFRVIYAGETANFSIKDCQKINGELSKWEKTIRRWHGDNKAKLIEVWDRTRPSDCPVGKYRD